MKILRLKVIKDNIKVSTKLEYEIIAGNSTKEVVERLEDKLRIKIEDYFYSAYTSKDGERVIILKGQADFIFKNYISRFDFNNNDKIKIFCYIKELDSVRSRVSTF